jgi:hypothetical protein
MKRAHAVKYYLRPERKGESVKMLLIIAVVLLISGFLLWVRKIILKRRMEKGLGRKVKDSELTSITGWMEAVQSDKAEDDKS